MSGSAGEGAFVGVERRRPLVELVASDPQQMPPKHQVRVVRQGLLGGRARFREAVAVGVLEGYPQRLQSLAGGFGGCDLGAEAGEFLRRSGVADGAGVKNRHAQAPTAVAIGASARAYSPSAAARSPIKASQSAATRGQNIRT